MRRMKKSKGKSKSVNMMGKSNEPFAKKAKKPEPDDKPHVRPLAPSTNKNMAKSHSARAKRLTGLML